MDWLEHLKKQFGAEGKKANIAPDDYMLTFSGDRGLRVLAHMLYEHHVFEEISPEDGDDMARRNVVVRILGAAGVFREENMLHLARAFMAIAKLNRKETQDGSL